MARGLPTLGRSLSTESPVRMWRTGTENPGKLKIWLSINELSDLTMGNFGLVLMIIRDV